MEKEFFEWDTIRDMITGIFLDNQELIENYDYLFPIPNGGYPVATILSEISGVPVCHDLETPLFPDEVKPKFLIVDDLIDSGNTIKNLDADCDTFVLFRKPYSPEVTFYVEETENWIVFPWENENGNIEENLTRVLQYLGEDPTREGLRDTPKRIVKSWEKLFGGYQKNPMSLLTEFDNPGYDEMVLLKNVEFYSTCEHHFLPFHGKAHIAYIPGDKVIGVSKLARLLEMYSRRLQIQERIGEQVVNFLMKELGAKGAGCILEAQHFCMTSRGVEKQNSIMTTSSLRGVFKDKKEARAELLSLIKN